jgi:membrane dipeptidase
MPRVGVKELLRHIDYVARLVGPDHVGLGSDFDGISGMVPVGMEDVSKYPVLVKGLNLLRVMRENERVVERGPI